ncbi:valine--tRNA ligase [Synechococcales cyanobacterium C]|uniref:Valine--tRNA ligase n=1 Tax=Petrachloros mirabilis ULC683 TaxID=2781853 RepID=A0A8K2A6Q1_9CYAN|nr:valine--tRNA ligase [Petrachloros mirabilis]NCJ06244.1 valine--tRNA ligase [Petrachloros mirabilis ULC683]
MTASVPDLPSQYDPAATEAKWQTTWETDQVFRADPNQGGNPYCIVIPPPNVTGSLHMGHAFEHSLIDVLIRYHRMIGDNTLWLPGTDHASIAVSTLLDRELQAQGQTREQVGREAYLERAWQWKAESGGTIVGQLRRLGLSVDWSRERFTMDEGLSRAVLTAFVQLYEEGLIYRGNYLVNWCPASQSAVSDLEVENQEVDSHLWHFRYPLTEGDGSVEVATTRPETMLGDTAVAVNPKDDRYQHLIGKTVRLPIVEREIPIIADEFVDPSFGTGCVKVTPAHDPNDFEMGQRHNLPFINILNKDGTLNHNGGLFEGMDRFEARKEVVDFLNTEGFLVKVEDYRHTVPYSDRGKVPVEPLLSTQWFVKVDPLAQKTLAFLDDEYSPRFVPERWTKVYRDWLVNLRDWCISRQLWWGHQIPAWYAVSETEGTIQDHTPFVVAHTETEAREKAIEQFGAEVQLQQDPDVLDTWFSAGLWPFSTLGWPEQTEDLAFYYPTATLVTGFDIIFFWVARMTLMGSHFTDQIPFQDVYIHGLVRDENNKKMSKSANNGIDPLVLIDRYGTDALRYTLIREVAGAGQDVRLEYNRKIDESASVEASRNFANKLWNASRFVLLNLEGQTPTQLGMPQADALELADRWILTRYHNLVEQTRRDLDDYALGEAAKTLYEFIWGDFCDWYLELVKSRLREGSPDSRAVAQQTLAYVLEGTLKLLHPFMPHITEEIWQILTQAEAGQYLAVQAYPTPEKTRPLIQATRTTPPDFWDDRPTVTALPPADAPSPAPELGKAALKLLADWPTLLPQFFSRYQAFFVLALLLFVVIVGVEISGAVIHTLNRIPLVGAGLELLGLFYLTQFIYQNLLWSDRRQAFGRSLKQRQRRMVQQIRTTPSEKSAPVAIQRLRAMKAEDQAQSETASTSEPPLTLDIQDQFDLLIGTIRTIRNLRAEANIKPGAPIPVILQSEQSEERQILYSGQAYIEDLAKLESLTITSTLDPELKQTMVGVVGTVQVLIPLAGVVDVEALRAKIERDLAKAEGEVKSLKDRLSNEKFVAQAPPEVVQGARNALAEAETQIGILRDRLQRL